MLFVVICCRTLTVLRTYSCVFTGVWFLLRIYCCICNQNRCRHFRPDPLPQAGRAWRSWTQAETSLAELNPSSHLELTRFYLVDFDSVAEPYVRYLTRPAAAQWLVTLFNNSVDLQCLRPRGLLLAITSGCIALSKVDSDMSRSSIAASSHL